MRKFLFILLFSWVGISQAGLTIEITEGAEGAQPVAVVPFGWQGKGAAPKEDIAAIISADLARSGRFKALPESDMLARPHTGDQVDFKDWKVLGMDSLVVGQLTPNGAGGYMVRFRLYDVFRGEQLTGYNVPTTERNLRATAHHIADIIYEQLTGEPGAFATRVAYITSESKGKGKVKVSIRVADADGFNPQTIVSSKEPLMSPAWSPDGRRLAYVSFERRKPSIFIQEVFTGRRDKVASFKGINGAPAWSPDGRSMAMTLSKDGNPDIFIMDLASKKVRAITRNFAIDTEPAWSPDGRHLVFTSDRGGKPQIYRVPVSGGKAERVTFENAYNARASYSPDGKSLTLVTRVGGKYRIAVLDLKSGNMDVLSRGSLDESPSFAPNGSMIMYATKKGPRDVLAAVSVDGRVRQRLALDFGQVREPVWSPYNQQQRRK